MRCFVGLPLPEGAAKSLAEARAALVELDPTWRDEKWVPAENLHLTVRFLGDLDDPGVAEATTAIAEAVAEVPAFSLPAFGIRAVPNERRCRMLWATYGDPEGVCGDLASAIVAATAHLGMPPEDRSFKPHATLCRARRPKRLDSAARAAADEAISAGEEFLSVARVTLFSSQLGRGTPRYEPVQEWMLR